jgi:hypothetical protein
MTCGSSIILFTLSTPSYTRTLRIGQSFLVRLEINTSVPYMTPRDLHLVLASRVHPVKRFLACRFPFTDSPGHAGVLHTRDIALRTHSGRAVAQ